MISRDNDNDPTQPHGAQATDPLNKDSSGPEGSTYGGLRDAGDSPTAGVSGEGRTDDPNRGTYDDLPANASTPIDHVHQRDAQRTLPDTSDAQKSAPPL